MSKTLPTRSVIINSVSGDVETSVKDTQIEQSGSTIPAQYGPGMGPVVTDPTVGIEILPNDDQSSTLRAKGLLRGLKLVLQHHGAPRAVVNSFELQAMAYLDIEEEAIFFKRAKYLTVAPMAQYLKVEKPKVPDQDIVWRGQYRNWAKTRLRCFCRKNTHLWYSFLQGKRSALPLSQDLVLTTYEEHRRAMEIEDPIDDETLEGVMKELEPVLKRVANSITDKYRGHLTYEDHIRYGGMEVRETRHVASTRACFETSRAKGGQLGYLSSLVPDVKRMNPSARASTRINPDLVRMVFYPMAVVSGRVRTNVVVEEYAYLNGEEAWTKTILGEAAHYTGEVKLKATIQAVLEPLKVRVISKGNAIPYYLSKPLQKAMHDAMRDMPCFRLIGRSLCPTDLIDLSENRVILGEGRYEWFSIDYSAATDNLSARLSSRIMQYLLQNQDDEIRSMWLSVLAPHYCRYPFPYSQTVKPVQQKNGQLMGSILSFPILCLANLGMYLYNIKDDTRPLRDKLNGVLVNGDDMLYVAKHSLWDTHVEIGNRVGLKMSPGKAYHHQVYANANSACFHYDLYNRRSTPWSIPFLNSGLYFGQSKVLGGDDEDGEHNLCSTVNRLIEGALPGRQCDVLKMFISRHRHELDRECRGRNLFIPKSLGGMGVEAPVGWTTLVTDAQRAVAWMRTEREPYGHLGGRPLLAPEVPDSVQPLKAPWLVLDKTEVEERDEIARAQRLLCRSKKRGVKRVAEFQGREIRFRLLARDLCSQDLLTCRSKRHNRGSNYHSIRPNRFAYQTAIDGMLEDLEWSIQNYEQPNPWAMVGLDLLICLENEGILG